MVDKEAALKRLREPFEPSQIGKLPKPYKADSPKSNCRECGGYHGQPAVHLDFVGHAALTDRLLEVDPDWSWEPFSVDANGLPAFDANGGLWIRLTIAGVTRPGYGDAQGKKGGNAVKEAIGDALRNGGMRFGAALDLWHKGDMHDMSEARGDNAAPTVVPKPVEPVPPAGWRADIAKCRSLEGLQAFYEADARHWFTDEVKTAFSARKKELTDAS